MLLGSCYAGMAFANAPVAAVHALAYPLGARFKVPHGLSNLSSPDAPRMHPDALRCTQMHPRCTEQPHRAPRRPT
eukprot:scaffold67633_cov56-Phaeocystis_antarctica.AAC.5